MARDVERVTREVVEEYTERAQNHWQVMLKEYRLEKARTEPVITLVANSNWIEYTVRYVVDYRKRRSTKDIIFSRFLDQLDHLDGKVSIASQTQEIVGFPDLSVGLREHLTIGESQ